MPNVDVLVTNDFLEDLPEGLRIMDAREITRVAEDDNTTRVTIDMPYVPEGALTVEPVFMSTPDAVRVQSLGWSY